jgi:type II secretory pathway predicted ATPase ExeA
MASSEQMLAAILKDKGISQREAARALGLSPASVNLLCRRGAWPRRDTAGVKARVAAWLEQLGVQRSEALAAVNAAAVAALNPPPGKAAVGLSRPERRGNGTTNTPRTEAGIDSRPDFAAAHGSGAKRAGLQDVGPERHLQKEKNIMIRRQTLSPKARRTFAITRDPFSENMEPEDVWLSQGLRFVRETMYSCAAHGGFLAVIGESGSGKSTLRKDLSCRLLRENSPVILIEPYVIGMEDNDINGKVLKATHIAEAILHTLAPSSKRPRSPETRMRQVHQVLRDSRRAGNRHCLVIEEAHSLNAHTIKHLKRFFELEDGGFTRLLSIILIGQTELRNKLSETDAIVREVVQRCETVEVHPLAGAVDVKGYVAHRCARVGLEAGKLFADAALDLLPALLTGTTPRKGQAAERHSLLYPLAVGNMLTLALNAAAEGGETQVTADVMAAL